MTAQIECLQDSVEQLRHDHANTTLLAREEHAALLSKVDQRFSEHGRRLGQLALWLLGLAMASNGVSAMPSLVKLMGGG